MRAGIVEGTRSSNCSLVGAHEGDWFSWSSHPVRTSNVARRHLLCKGDIVNFRPHHHDVATDDGWGGDAVETPVNRTTQPLGQVDAPAPAKGWDRLAVCAFRQIR